MGCPKVRILPDDATALSQEAKDKINFEYFFSSGGLGTCSPRLRQCKSEEGEKLHKIKFKTKLQDIDCFDDPCTEEVQYLLGKA